MASGDVFRSLKKVGWMDSVEGPVLGDFLDKWAKNGARKVHFRPVIIDDMKFIK